MELHDEAQQGNSEGKSRDEKFRGLRARQSARPETVAGQFEQRQDAVEAEVEVTHPITRRNPSDHP